MKKTNFKPLRTLMQESEDIAPMMRKVALIARLQKTYADAIHKHFPHLTHLHETSRVAAIEGTTLVVAVANGAIATTLKQMLPRLLERYRENIEETEIKERSQEHSQQKINRKISENKKQEQEVTLIRILVQPEYFGPDLEPKPVRRTQAATMPMPSEALGQLAMQLNDSPLKETLKRIQKRRERALTTTKKPS
jgi:Dna[CI] antecedent, DciA